MNHAFARSETGLARDTAHNFFARFDAPSSQGGRRLMSTASGGY